MTSDLIERGEALGALQAALHAVTEDGKGRIALVAGEAGIGKTSVLRAFAAANAATPLWWGGCDALQTPHPLAPLHDIARDSQPHWREALGGARPALFEAVLDELRHAAMPTLVVVEDAHWADDATLDLIKFLGRRIERTKAVLAVSFRDDEMTAAHPLRRVIGELPSALLLRVVLPRLSAQAVEALARRAQRPAEGLYAATRGNPFFVTELLRHEVEGVPPSAQALVLARFARLTAGPQAIVRLASIVPGRIERWLIDELLAPTPADLQACLDSGLLLADSAMLSFRHELARRAVEQSIDAPQHLHAQVLAALGARGGAPLPRLVHHAALAGDSASVLRFAPAAARQAASQGAHREAAAHYASALAHVDVLALPQRAELYDARAYGCYLIGDMEQAAAARESALLLWRSLGHAPKVGDTLRWLSRLHWFLGHKSAADAHAAAAISALEALPPSLELAMAYSNQAQLHALADEMAPAVKWGERAIALAERLGNSEILTHALTNIGTARYRNGLLEGALQLERSLMLALEGGHEEHAARAYCNLAIAGIMVRDYARAAPAIDTGIAYCADHDLDAWSYYLLACRAQLHVEQGRWDAAVADADAVLARPGVAAIARIPALVALGRIRARRGDPGAAEVLDEAWAQARPTGELQRVWPVAMARAEAAWIQGDNEACATEVLSCLDLARRLGNPRAIGECELWLRRAGAPIDKPLGVPEGDAPEPCALQLSGHWREAAAAWAALGRPFDRALALADGDTAARCEALSLIEGMGAHAVAQRLRTVLRRAGVRDLPPTQRGPRASTREHPFGLTQRELQTLQLLCEGLRNAEIAQRLHRSVRTVDHHLAAVFAKLGVDSRAAAIAVAQHAQIGQRPRAK